MSEDHSILSYFNALVLHISMEGHCLNIICVVADLAAAISDVKKEGLQIPLVVFGHMHRDLKYGRPRRRTMLFVGPDGTVYLNAAVVPRVQKLVSSDDRALTQRHFVLVEFQGREVEHIHEVWVTVGPEGVNCETQQALMYPCNAPAL